MRLWIHTILVRGINSLLILAVVYGVLVGDDARISGIIL